MLELTGITKRFNEGQPHEVVALRDVSLRIERAQVTVLGGPSGSGKTTLLTVLGCLARPSEGRVRLDGDVVSNLPERHLALLRRRSFGFVFQRFNLINGFSALENVMLPAYPDGLPYGSLRERAMAEMQRLDIGHRATAPVELLSGGEMQRVAIARALINSPSVLIADEPTANLDTGRTAQFLEIVQALKARGLTVVMSSHDPRITRSDRVDRYVAMEDGRIVEGAS